MSFPKLLTPLFNKSKLITVYNLNYFRDELSILVKDHLWKMEGHLMQTIFPLGEFSPNMMLKAITRGRNIVEM